MQYLIMTSQHSSEHHKVRSSSDGLGNVTRTGAATILSKTVRCKYLNIQFFIVQSNDGHNN